MPSLFVGPTGQYINTQGPSGSEMKAEAPKKKRTVIKLGTPYVAAEYIAKETARKREKALAGLRKVESETKARNTKREEEAKRPWYDSYQNAVEVALQLIEDQPELSRKEIEEGSGINQAKEDNSWSRDSVDDNKTHLEVENYIYDNWDKKADKIFEKREEEQVQEDIKKFKAKYGSQLPTTAAKALHIPKNMLLPALRVAGFNQKDAKQAYNKYSYSGTYGFRIHKTPKRLMISEEKSDFDKEWEQVKKTYELPTRFWSEFEDDMSDKFRKAVGMGYVDVYYRNPDTITHPTIR